jgi:hypothetical protein
MDHLILPSGVEKFILTPYEAPQDDWYDGKGFLDYPARKDWVEDSLRGVYDLNQGSWQELQKTEQFFQTWLFFGLAIDFFAVGGIKLTTEDFLKPDDPDIHARIVTTSQLPNWIKKWSNQVQDKHDETWNKLQPMFDRAKFILDLYCTPVKDDRPLLQKKPPRWPVRDEISVTMITMAWTLFSAASSICKHSSSQTLSYLTARSSMLDKRIERKWCLSDAAGIEESYQIDGHYFFAAMQGPNEAELDRHYLCTRKACVARVDERLYITKHADAPWHTENCRTTGTYENQLGPERGQKDWTDAMSRILDKDATPLALWSQQTKGLWSVEFDKSGVRRPPFIAISHV